MPQGRCGVLAGFEAVQHIQDDRGVASCRLRLFCRSRGRSLLRKSMSACAYMHVCQRFAMAQARTAQAAPVGTYQCMLMGAEQDDVLRARLAPEQERT